MIASSLPVLSLAIVFPLLALIGLVSLRQSRSIRYYALGVALAELLLTALPLLLFDFDSNRIQFIERMNWIPGLNIGYVVGVDGLSVVFPFLTAWVNLAVIVATWPRLQHQARLPLASLFILESMTIGVFCALDLVLFLLFWELTLVPVFLLVNRYGIGPERHHAAVKYTLLMLGGSAALLTGFLLLAINHAEQLGLPLSSGFSFDYLTLLHVPVASEMQSVIFWLLLSGFAVRVPAIPFHTWLPTLALEGPLGLTAWLGGLNLGLYGILRIAIPLAPGAAHAYKDWLLALGLGGLIYAGLMALRQTNLRCMLAWASISHAGAILAGITSLTVQGVQGALLQLTNLSIVLTGLFLLAEFIRQRTATTELAELDGLARLMPRFTALFLLLGLAAIGTPGTGSFSAGLLLLIGTFKAHTGAGLAMLSGNVLTASYFFNACRQVFPGTPPPHNLTDGMDLRPRETLLAVIMVILSLLPGLMPNLFTTLTQKSVTVWITRLNHSPEGSAYARITGDAPDYPATGLHHPCATTMNPVSCRDRPAINPRKRVIRIPIPDTHSG